MGNPKKGLGNEKKKKTRKLRNIIHEILTPFPFPAALTLVSFRVWLSLPSMVGLFAGYG